MIRSMAGWEFPLRSIVLGGLICGLLGVLWGVLALEAVRQFIADERSIERVEADLALVPPIQTEIVSEPATEKQTIPPIQKSLIEQVINYEKEDEVTNYVIFKRVPHGDEIVVVTGWQFSSSKSKTPVKQWCYADLKSAPSGGARPRVDLASQWWILPAIYSAVTPEAARTLGQSVDTLENIAKTHCRFFESGDGK